MRLFLGSLLTGSTLLAGSLVAASAYAVPSSRLVYVRGEGAEACPEVMELRLAVLHRLGYNPFDPNAKQSILVQLRRDQEHLRATVELLDAEGLSRGSRHLDAPTNSCDELISAAALSISLAIDPERALAQTEAPKSKAKLATPEAPAPDPPTGTLPADNVEPSFDPTPVTPTSQTQRELLVALHGASGALVEPTLGAAVGLGLRRPLVSLSLEGRADLPRSRELGTNAHVTTWLLMATLVPCLRGAALRFCGLLSYGVLGASSSGVKVPKDDRVPYAALGLRLGTEVRVSRRLRLGVHVDCLASLWTTHAKLGDSTIWEPNRLSGLFGLDAAWDIL